MSLHDLILQVRAAMGNDMYGHCASVVPTLGLSWSNLVTTRLMISRTDSFIPGTAEVSKSAQKASRKTVVEYNIRQLEIVFCPWKERKSCRFVVTSKGIEDVE